MKATGTLAFLIRLHLAPFVAGVILIWVAARGLWNHQPPAPGPLDGIAASPFAAAYVPVMWVVLMVGVILAVRAVAKAWASAHR